MKIITLFSKTLFLISLVTILLIGCQQKGTITNAADYTQYLSSDNSKQLASIDEEINFWRTKLDKTPEQFSYLSPLANEYAQKFDATGNIQYLMIADSLLTVANSITNHHSSGLLRSQARNFISQHRFKEALTLLKKAEKMGDDKKVTEAMLFDVHLELGNTRKASRYLNAIKEEGSFDYLIRLSKWSDHNGDLTAAIRNLEHTLPFVETSSSALKIWTYTNLADYYGHAGLLHKSYRHYLKALDLDPNNAYALKGIAWIAFSHENNVAEAKKIIAAIEKKYLTPDLLLFKAQIAEFEEKDTEKETYLTAYHGLVANKDYGAMYNKYNVDLYAQEVESHERAISLAKSEIANRPTVQSYDLLAWSYFKAGKVAIAKEIADNKVKGLSTEPEILLHLAQIYKAAGDQAVAASYKKELLASTYELGPNSIATINQL